MINIDKNNKDSEIIVKGNHDELLNDITNLVVALKEEKIFSKEILIKTIELGYAESKEEKEKINTDIILLDLMEIRKKRLEKEEK